MKHHYYLKLYKFILYIKVCSQVWHISYRLTKVSVIAVQLQKQVLQGVACWTPLWVSWIQETRLSIHQVRIFLFHTAVRIHPTGQVFNQLNRFFIINTRTGAVNAKCQAFLHSAWCSVIIIHQYYYYCNG